MSPYPLLRYGTPPSDYEHDLGTWRPVIERGIEREGQPLLEWPIKFPQTPLFWVSNSILEKVLYWKVVLKAMGRFRCYPLQRRHIYQSLKGWDYLEEILLRSYPRKHSVFTNFTG